MSSILYLDLGMGAAGDMLSAALFELIPDREKFLQKLNSAGIEDVIYSPASVKKCGVAGTKMNVLIHGETEEFHQEEGKLSEQAGQSGLETYEHAHDQAGSHEHAHDHAGSLDHAGSHEHTHDHAGSQEHTHHHSEAYEQEHHYTESQGHAHHHTGMHEIEHTVAALNVPDEVKNDILAVYKIIADAESRVHNEPVNRIHFHEVGEKDAVADITAVCLLMHELNPDKVIASPVHVGSGTVRCAHGILPVPAPATALILNGLPVYSTDIKGELCTPTGAALVRYYADEFAPMPVMRIKSCGYGMGSKDFPRLNCVRALLGESEDFTDTVTELSCNIDDMTGEDIGFAVGKLLEEGAKDVFTVPVMMKKSRPGILLCVLCENDDSEKFARLLFAHTTTIGIRKTIHERYVLDREIAQKETPFGTIRCKISSGYGVSKEKPEFDDLAGTAKSEGKSIAEIRSAFYKN